MPKCEMCRKSEELVERKILKGKKAYELGNLVEVCSGCAKDLDAASYPYLVYRERRIEMSNQMHVNNLSLL